jgi:hypothetical protein
VNFTKLFGKRSTDELKEDLRRVGNEILAIEKRLEQIPLDVRVNAFDEAKCAELDREEEEGKSRLRRLQAQRDHLRAEYDRRTREEELATAVRIGESVVEDLDAALESYAAAQEAVARERAHVLGLAQRAIAAWRTASVRGRLHDLPDADGIEARLKRVVALTGDENIATAVPRPEEPQEGDRRVVHVVGVPEEPRAEVFHKGRWVADTARLQIRTRRVASKGLTGRNA